VNWIARMACVPSEIESRPDADPVDVPSTRRFQEAVGGLQCPTFALMVRIGSMGGYYIKLYSIVTSSNRIDGETARRSARSGEAECRANLKSERMLRQKPNAKCDRKVAGGPRPPGSYELD
jgi:hypothetical protein